MLAVVLGAMVVNVPFMFFGCCCKTTISKTDKVVINIRLACIFHWFFVEIFFHFLYLVKKSGTDNGWIFMRIFFIIANHDAMIKSIIEHPIQFTSCPIKGMFSIN